jgi:hypothetical protein
MRKTLEVVPQGLRIIPVKLVIAKQREVRDPVLEKSLVETVELLPEPPGAAADGKVSQVNNESRPASHDFTEDLPAFLVIPFPPELQIAGALGVADQDEVVSGTNDICKTWIRRNYPISVMGRRRVTMLD